jgi:hypothetical protein
MLVEVVVHMEVLVDQEAVEMRARVPLVRHRLLELPIQAVAVVVQIIMRVVEKAVALV